MLNTLNGLFIAAVLAGTPLLLGALGEILTEKSGNLNLGVEGMMFMGAITGLAGSYYYEQAVIGSGGNPNGAVSSVIALLTSFAAGSLGALIYSFLTITLRANQNVTGLTLTIFGTGFGNFFGEYIGQKAGGYVAVSEVTKKAFSGIDIPVLSDIPVLGPLLFRYNWVVYFAIAAALFMTWFFNRTRVGLNLRAVGEDPATADAAGEGESTTDLVFGGHNIIAEDGTILRQSERYKNEIIYSEIDLEKIVGERRKNTTFSPEKLNCGCPVVVPFHVGICDTVLTRNFSQHPFVPSDEAARAHICDEILTIQAMGLKKRLSHTNAKSAVVGISGGLDSTLALLVTAKAFDMLGRDKKEIIAVTMPCFGTTDRTYNNACEMTRQTGATLIEVPIGEAVNVHFRDIGHDPDVHDVTYENAQARERTQVLMDIANREAGMVIGTGDMSELALGWATYNGDHMSMYGVNASVPKTLVRHLVQHAADTTENESLRQVLYDVLDTPVSPELLPPKDGDIAQKTEDLVGPYELHDFYLYYMLRFGFSPEKIFTLAVNAFAGVYEKETILKWLKIFYRRFFSQQFKRSCLPDGPKVGSVALSPRGDWRMPSDACAALWLKELEQLQ